MTLGSLSCAVYVFAAWQGGKFAERRGSITSLKVGFAGLAACMTAGALEEYITKGLRGRYLLNPQVTVTIDEYRSFYVNGMVEKPGGYAFSPGMTVRKAITLAGGFKERASREKINIIRDDDPKQTPRKVDLNAPVLPGDILTIEESFF